MQVVRTSCLELAYETYGPDHGLAVILLHGFPYAPASYHAVAPALAAHGLRVIVPWLRGFGPTRFSDAATARSGQQAALGHDLLELIDALAIDKAILVGYDWGGRAACIVAALWPERVHGLVTCLGYNIQAIAQASNPAPPHVEHALWYQYYLHGERGRLGLEANRQAFCRLLWQQWSPTWAFDDGTFQRSAIAFENPDFVSVVVHSYRHRYGLVDGDPNYESTEQALAAQPPISVPSISIDGDSDRVAPPSGSATHAQHFSGSYERRVLPEIGHNPPQEAPSEIVSATLALR